MLFRSNCRLKVYVFRIGVNCRIYNQIKQFWIIWNAIIVTVTKRYLYLVDVYITVDFDDTLIKAVSRKVKDNPEFRETTIRDTTNHEIVQQSQSRSPSPGKITTEEVTKTTENTIPSAPTLVTTTTPLTSPALTTPSGTVVMWLRKTEYPDVYDVYTTDHGMAQNTKAGIAHVPTLQVSKWLRNEFKSATVAMYIPFI